jgi:hypothetical protein
MDGAAFLDACKRAQILRMTAFWAVFCFVVGHMFVG